MQNQALIITVDSSTPQIPRKDFGEKLKDFAVAVVVASLSTQVVPSKLSRCLLQIIYTQENMFKVKTHDDFVCRVAHILTREHLTAQEMLDCIRLAYLELAFTEIERTPEQDALLAKIYTQEK